jgi:hypothetical protein
MAQGTKTGLRTIRLPEEQVRRLTDSGPMVAAADKLHRERRRPGSPSVSDIVALAAEIGLGALEGVR